MFPNINNIKTTEVSSDALGSRLHINSSAVVLYVEVQVTTTSVPGDRLMALEFRHHCEALPIATVLAAVPQPADCTVRYRYALSLPREPQIIAGQLDDMLPLLKLASGFEVLAMDEHAVDSQDLFEMTLTYQVG